jgi:ribonuclease P protein component
MLDKIYRLPSSVKLFHAQSFSSALFFLKVTSNQQAVSRFGFVVSKKIDPRATARNRIRRVFRSCIEELVPQIKPGFDMLFLLKQPILEIEREKLYNEVHKFFLEKHFLR